MRIGGSSVAAASIFISRGKKPRHTREAGGPGGRNWRPAPGREEQGMFSLCRNIRNGRLCRKETVCRGGICGSCLLDMDRAMRRYNGALHTPAEKPGPRE